MRSVVGQNEEEECRLGWELSHHPPTRPKCPHEVNVSLGLDDKEELYSDAEGCHVSVHLGVGYST